MRLTEQCYAITGLYFIPPWYVNAGIICGKSKTLVIDSGSSSLTAQTIYGYAQALRPANTIQLINTEKHLDHIGGNSYFAQKGIPIYGHYMIERKQNELEEMIESLNKSLPNKVRSEAKEGALAFKETKIVNPDRKIEQDIKLDLGGFAVNILLTPGHTKTNLSVYCEKDKALYCGDAILEGFLPNLEEGNKEDWKIWLESLAKLNKLPIEILVPGHGAVVTGKAAIQELFLRMEKILKQAVKENKAPTVSPF